MSSLPLLWVRISHSMLLLLLLVLLLPAVRTRAEDFHARIGNSVVVLAGPWKFHPGDDPAWRYCARRSSAITFRWVRPHGWFQCLSHSSWHWE